jgi:uncharacterized cupredoxin-like copper-binding protein
MFLYRIRVPARIRIPVTAFGLAVLAGGAHGHSMAGKPEWAAFGMPGNAKDPARTVTVIAAAMRFKPDTIDVRRGETIRFVITNNGPTKHEFVIGDHGFHMQHIKEMEEMPDMPMDEENSVDLRPGQTKVLLWRFTNAGEFLFGCDIPGHFQSGMVGRIHVH